LGFIRDSGSFLSILQVLISL